MKVYKLTDANSETRNHTKWGENVTHETNGQGDLCGPGWLHCYSDPLLAAFLNPMHADFSNPILWEAEGGVHQKDDHGLKMGFSKLTTICQIPLPEVTMEQRIIFGILCGLKVDKANAFVAWAEKWLSGEDRTESAANAAYTANATYAANAAATYAAYAANAAAYAANAAAAAANAAYTANAAAYAAYATYAAAKAAYAAGEQGPSNLDLSALAKEAMAYGTVKK